jgi:hypothetical protein
MPNSNQKVLCIMRQFVLFLAVNIALIGFLTGCGGGGPELATVTGTVTYKKEPLKQGTIVFHPENGRPATGKIVNGQILDVATNKSGDGVTVGANKVTISARENPDDMYNEKSLIPQKYNDFKKTNLSADIKSGKNEVKFDLVD